MNRRPWVTCHFGAPRNLFCVCSRKCKSSRCVRDDNWPTWVFTPSVTQHVRLRFWTLNWEN